MKKSSKKRKKAMRRMRNLRRGAIAVVSLALIVCVLASIIGSPSDRRDSLRAPLSDLKDNGLIRVYLKSLGAREALGLTLDGAYTVDGDPGFRFARGAQLSVAANGGSLLLSCGGMTIDMGSSFTLTRHLPSDKNATNGLYIHESEKDALFAGDLTLSNTGSSIDAILKIHVEDYLLGVVGYEMSDSFPLEALKAQAVAARTYAMRAKKNAAGKAYDVVDTTADQVYKGFDPSFKNVIRAVEETRGVVGVYNGTYAGCYYTASNGGQIASGRQIWGGGGTEYIEMKDDPYDLENTLSVVKRAEIPFTPAPGSEIANALAAELSEALALMGYSDDVNDIRIDRINAITLSDPDVEGSYMYKSMVFDVSISGRRLLYPETEQTSAATPEEAAEVEATASEAEATAIEATEAEAAPAEAYTLSDFMPIEGERTVALLTYGGVEKMLNISINASNTELFSVTKTKTGFEIAARRFGHGVGMSQRGAQTMAGKHGKTCLEILNFYYPGMAVETIEWDTPSLTAIDALPASVGAARPRPTPKPTPAPLPSLKDSEYYARVTLSSASSTLNVRQGPTTASAIVGTLSSGDRLIVLSEAEDGWFKIKTAELSGYVKGDYIIKE